jgi:hypothetical protein
MGLFSDDDVKDAKAKAKADAKADRKAGGFGLGWAGQGKQRSTEKSEKATRAYDQTYTRKTPRSWRSR